MAKVTNLEKYQAISDDALNARSLMLRQKSASEILTEARKHLSWDDFKKLQDYVFMRLEK